MRILLLCDRYPYPLANGQNLRVFHYVRELNARHEFDLLCYGDGQVPEPVQSLFRRVESFPRPRPEAARGLRRLAEAFDVERMVAGSAPTAERLAKLLSSRSYDLVWISGWDMVVNLPPNRAVPVLMDMVDDGVLEFWRELLKARTPWRAARMAKWLWMNYRFERRYFRPNERCLVVSDVDAACFRRISPGTPVSVVNNGVDEAYFHPGGGPVDSRSIVFEGNIAFAPNHDGIVHFCRRVLPLIRRELPDVRLTIVGKDPPADVQAFQADGVEVTGFVDDVRPFVDRAALFVCPLRKGAGIKNKVLQAWAMGKAVVATTPSIGGLRIQPEENIVVRDDPALFAGAVVELLADPVRRIRIAQAARRTVLEHYTWSQKARELEQAMLLAARAPLPEAAACATSS